MRFKSMSKRPFNIPKYKGCAEKEYSTIKDNPSATFKTASHFINVEKNRYSNILADDASRVQLAGEDDVTNYVNANFVLADYIATQAPLAKSLVRSKETISDFWLMVWQQRSPIIIMLTKLTEKKRTKADKYWPEKESETFGDITVTSKKVSNLKNIIIRKFEIQCGTESRIIHHLQYNDWPDWGIPESTSSLRTLISLVNFYRISYNELDGRIICHCSAGIGRTGTFIASHHIISLIDAGMNPDDINIRDIVMQMRNHRSGMVQTEDQYKFIYQTINEWVQQKVNQLPSKKKRMSKTGSLCFLPSCSTTSIPTVDDRDMLTSSHNAFVDRLIVTNV